MESRHALSAGLVVLLALLVPAGFANAGGAEPAPVSRATIYYAWAEDQRPTSDSFEQIAEKWNCVFEFDADSDELRTLRSAFGNATDGEFAEKRTRAKVQFAGGRSVLIDAVGGIREEPGGRTRKLMPGDFEVVKRLFLSLKAGNECGKHMLDQWDPRYIRRVENPYISGCEIPKDGSELPSREEAKKRRSEYLARARKYLLDKIGLVGDEGFDINWMGWDHGSCIYIQFERKCVQDGQPCSPLILHHEIYGVYVRKADASLVYMTYPPRRAEKPADP